MGFPFPVTKVILFFRFHKVAVNDSILWFQVGFDYPLFSVQNSLSFTYFSAEGVKSINVPLVTVYIGSVLAGVR